MKPIIYQLFPRLFTNINFHLKKDGDIISNGVGKMNDLNVDILSQIRQLGVTHIWLTGVIEHATTTDYSQFGISPDAPAVVKGKAGSPYAIKDYYDIDPDIAVDVNNRIGEFESLVKRIHSGGMKVVIDFVPNHVARHYQSDAKPRGVKDFGSFDRRDWFFARDNNFYYINAPFSVDGVDLGNYIENPARATGNDCFSAHVTRNDWYETVKLNYGIDYSDGSRHFSPIPDTWGKMLHILKYWVKKGVDTFRCDMAFMVPTEFWRWAIPQVKEMKKSVEFIAEIYDVGKYREFIESGFDYLYDKVNLYDMLVGIERNGWSADAITSCWQKVDGLSDHMLNFLENHDEVRFASSAYAGDAFNVLPSLVISSMIHRGPFMLYQGQELGESGEDEEGFSGHDGRTTIFDYWSMSSLRRFLSGKATKRELALRDMYATALNICNRSKAVSNGDFYDLTYANYHSPYYSTYRQFTFLRHFKNELLFIIVNFDNVAVNVMVNVPEHAFSHLNIPYGAFAATELLSGKSTRVILRPDLPFKARVKAKGAVIYQIQFD